MNPGAGNFVYPLRLVISIVTAGVLMNASLPKLLANRNDSKKFKAEFQNTGVPSRVVHVRKLPNDVTEAEVISLGLPFGKVTNLLMLKGKNQVRSTARICLGTKMKKVLVSGSCHRRRFLR